MEDGWGRRGGERGKRRREGRSSLGGSLITCTPLFHHTHFLSVFFRSTLHLPPPQASDVRWASRWDTFLAMGDDQIHWFSIINSLMIVSEEGRERGEVARWAGRGKGRILSLSSMSLRRRPPLVSLLGALPRLIMTGAPWAIHLA